MKTTSRHWFRVGVNSSSGDGGIAFSTFRDLDLRGETDVHIDFAIDNIDAPSP